MFGSAGAETQRLFPSQATMQDPTGKVNALCSISPLSGQISYSIRCTVNRNLEPSLATFEALRLSNHLFILLISLQRDVKQLLRGKGGDCAVTGSRPVASILPSLSGCHHLSGFFGSTILYITIKQAAFRTRRSTEITGKNTPISCLPSFVSRIPCILNNSWSQT